MQINGCAPRELAVEIDGEGPPVLMVHGLGGTSNFYQAQALADRFQVIRVDSGGDEKTGPPAVSQALADAHGSATVAVIDGIGHWTALEAAGEVTDHLLKFL
jgi:3-oxoadipate enol-lactonase